MPSHQVHLLAWLVWLVLPGCGGLREAITADHNLPPTLTEKAAGDKSTEAAEPQVIAAVPGEAVRQGHVKAGAKIASEHDEVAHAGYVSDELADLDTLMRLPPIDSTTSEITYIDLFQNQWSGIVSDYQQFYSLPNITWLAASVGAGAVMANTSFDEHFIHHEYVENIILAPSHEYAERFHQAKFLGDGYYTIPLFAALSLAEPLIDDLPYGSTGAQWGQRSLRTILVGGPPLLGLQYVIGGSRPGESLEQSEWKPFTDNNGVSGHAFIGAIPFLSAAKMTDNLWAKSGLYAASALPGISRVNDDAHYLSQVWMGWCISYLAASAVDRSYDPDANVKWFWFSNGDSQGIALELRH